jgi:lipopolysaccharide export system permease protein
MLRLPKKAISYIFFEMWPSLLLGLGVFLLILVMTQAIRYTEFILIHGVSLGIVAKMFGYLCISFLPALLPMGLLFAVLLTYSRLSQDSELVAFKAAGMSMGTILLPGVLLGLFVSILSAQTSFSIAPWGNRQFELIINELGHTKASATLREGTFSEGFFDLVVYAQKVDSKTGQLEKVFIFDERSIDTPLTIVSRKGQIVQSSTHFNHSLLMQLSDGDIHRKTNTHTKIKFSTFDLRLNDPIKFEEKKKSLQSLTLNELNEFIDKKNPDYESRILQVEYHKRWAISLACLILSLVAVGLGAQANQRSQRGNTIVYCLGIVIGYWVCYITFEGLAREAKLPVIPAIWATNTLFFFMGTWLLARKWKV